MPNVTSPKLSVKIGTLKHNMQKEWLEEERAHPKQGTRTESGHNETHLQVPLTFAITSTKRKWQMHRKTMRVKRINTKMRENFSFPLETVLVPKRREQ